MSEFEVMPPRNAVPGKSRCAVVDLGSNSVRLVVFEGINRNPLGIYNEKAVLRLGRGLQTTGQLNEEGVVLALSVLGRFYAVARAMGAETMEVLATAAVRDATNGADFVAALKARLPGVIIHILTGEQEANYSAEGVLCGIPNAEGLLADIGGGSLELVQIGAEGRGPARTLPLGLIRLTERSGQDPIRARAIAEADLATIPWLNEGAGRSLYLVGGAWRALARVHMAQSGYALNVVHHYTLQREEARALTTTITESGRRALERMAGVPRRRIDDLPYAAIVLRRLLRATGAARVVFSANGMREGWYLRRMPREVQEQDPVIAAGQDFAFRLGRDMALPPALFAWMTTLFPVETTEQARLREAACWISDIGNRDHPEFRAEQAFLRVLRQPGVALDHPMRAFLALAVATRYEAEADAPFLAPAKVLLDPASIQIATVIGTAARLAYVMCAGTADLLAHTSIDRRGETLVLRIRQHGGVVANDSVLRQLDRLAQVTGLQAVSETRVDA